MTRLVCFLTLGIACAVAQTVEGTVINSATGEGLGGVKVTILLAGATVYTHTTDAKGRFRIENVADGSYMARYSSDDYLLNPIGSTPAVAVKSGQALQAFQVAAGTGTVKLEARMTHFGRISGRVIDGRGDPVPGAGVQLKGPSMSLGTPADAQGRFNLHNYLLPGAYQLSATPSVRLNPPDREPDSDRVLSWTKTYYPGVASPVAASKIVLLPGTEVLDIELKLLAVPAHALRGVLLNSDGDPVPKTTITLGYGYPGVPPFATESKPDGTFEFPSVVDGVWKLSAALKGEGVDLQAAEWIEMAGREIDRVKLSLRAPFTLQGKVVMETPQGTPAPAPPSTVSIDESVGAVNREFTVSLREWQSHPDAQGYFILGSIYPGSYSISASKPPPPYYLDSIRVGDAEVTAPDMEFSGPASVTLVYKADGGIVRGSVEKCASGSVWLFPQDVSLRRQGFYSMVTCDPNDRYEITGVRPGEYYALAFRSGAASWPTIVSHDSLFSQATKVTVRRGEPSAVDLGLIQSPF
jgi:hypothetical protein